LDKEQDEVNAGGYPYAHNKRLRLRVFAAEVIHPGQLAVEDDCFPMEDELLL